MTFDISTPSAMTTTLRQIANAIGGALIGVGFVNEAEWQFWTGILISGGVAVYAIYKQIVMRKAD